MRTTYLIFRYICVIKRVYYKQNVVNTFNKLSINSSYRWEYFTFFKSSSWCITITHNLVLNSSCIFFLKIRNNCLSISPLTCHLSIPILYPTLQIHSKFLIQIYKGEIPYRMYFYQIFFFKASLEHSFLSAKLCIYYTLAEM